MAKEKDVKYEDIVFDELPDRPPRGSQLEEKLDTIKANTSLNGKFTCIAQYGQGTAATAAANIGRKRHGGPGAYGWVFATRKITLPGETQERTGLFVSYNPSKVVAGEAEKFEAEKAAREKAAKDKAAKKKAESAKTTAPGNTTEKAGAGAKR